MSEILQCVRQSELASCPFLSFLASGFYLSVYMHTSRRLLASFDAFQGSKEVSQLTGIIKSNSADTHASTRQICFSFF